MMIHWLREEITKDLALGTVLGDALGIEVLPEEAAKIGKAAAVQLSAAKKADETIAGNARARRAKARKRAEGAPSPPQ